MTRSKLLASVVFTAALAWSHVSRAQTPASTPAVQKPASAPTEAQKASVAVSSATASEPTAQDLYPIDKTQLRDPFQKSGGSGGGNEVELTEVNIHNLVLKGILHDQTGDFALFVDPESGSNLYLKKEMLFNARNQAIPGVSGVINAKQKTVHLITSEKDVQTFVLGEQGGP